MRRGSSSIIEWTRFRSRANWWQSWSHSWRQGGNAPWWDWAAAWKVLICLVSRFLDRFATWSLVLLKSFPRRWELSGASTPLPRLNQPPLSRRPPRQTPSTKASCLTLSGDFAGSSAKDLRGKAVPRWTFSDCFSKDNLKQSIWELSRRLKRGIKWEFQSSMGLSFKVWLHLELVLKAAGMPTDPLWTLKFDPLVEKDR